MSAARAARLQPPRAPRQREHAPKELRSKRLRSKRLRLGGAGRCARPGGGEGRCLLPHHRKGRVVGDDPRKAHAEFAADLSATRAPRVGGARGSAGSGAGPASPGRAAMR
jgi:hypothetical protein